MPRSRKVVFADRAFSVEMAIMDHMRKTSLVAAKSHLSELVDAAEHRGQRVLILRRGKPAAAIVPISVAQQPEAGADDSHRLSRRAFRALLDRVAATPKSKESIDTVLGRGRLDKAIGTRCDSCSMRRWSWPPRDQLHPLTQPLERA